MSKKINYCEFSISPELLYLLVSWENIEHHADHNVNLSNNDSSNYLLATQQLPSVFHIFHYVVCLAFPIASFIPWTQQQYPWMHMIGVYSNNTDSGNNKFVAWFKEDFMTNIFKHSCLSGHLSIQQYKWYKSVSSSSKFNSQNSNGTSLGEKMIFLRKWQALMSKDSLKCVISYFSTQPRSPSLYLATVRPFIGWVLMGRTRGGLLLVWEDRFSSTFISETTQFTGLTNRLGSFTKQQWETHKDRWLISPTLF